MLRETRIALAVFVLSKKVRKVIDTNSVDSILNLTSHDFIVKGQIVLNRNIVFKFG